jgi:predicted Rossmann fold nucleotide-binding protein DprA/Smf involved in DNA uptake
MASLQKTEAGYPFALKAYLGKLAPEQIYYIGNLDILQQKKLALFCSVKCPGNLILKTYNLARELRSAGTLVVSGFHSPMEKECFTLLLRGKQAVIWCPARRLATKRLLKMFVGPVSDGRLLIISPFSEEIRRATQDTARVRNDCVAALGDSVFVAYAATGGKTEGFCRKILEWQKPLYTFESPYNASLVTLGARPFQGVASIISRL